jgi:hypothetical protein
LCNRNPSPRIRLAEIVQQPAEQFDWKSSLIGHLAQRKDMALSITVLDFLVVEDYSRLVPKTCLAVSVGPRRTFNKRERISL